MAELTPSGPTAGLGGPARRGAAIRSFVVILVVVGLDQLTKHTIGTSIRPDQTRHVIGSVLEFVYERNTGVAFSFLRGGGAAVYIATGVALACLIAYLTLRPGRRWLWLPTGMLVGGAIGNLIDRISEGSVIDFIKLPHWPVFNVADIAITFGVIILVILIEFGPDRPRQSDANQSSDRPRQTEANQSPDRPRQTQVNQTPTPAGEASRGGTGA